MAGKHCCGIDREDALGFVCRRVWVGSGCSILSTAHQGNSTIAVPVQVMYKAAEALLANILSPLLFPILYSSQFPGAVGIVGWVDRSSQLLLSGWPWKASGITVIFMCIAFNANISCVTMSSPPVTSRDTYALPTVGSACVNNEDSAVSSKRCRTDWGPPTVTCHHWGRPRQVHPSTEISLVCASERYLCLPMSSCSSGVACGAQIGRAPVGLGCGSVAVSRARIMCSVPQSCGASRRHTVPQPMPLSSSCEE